MHTPSHPIAHRFSAGALVVLFAACGDAPPAEQPLRATTENGVEVITSSGPTQADSVEVAFRFGAIEGAPDELFDQIRDIGLVDESSLWVVDRNPSVRRYAFDGTLLQTVGARGDGPGETSSGFGWVYPGDGEVLVLADDPKLIRFDADGGVIAEARPFIEGSGSPIPIGRAAAGWIYRLSSSPAEEGAGRGTWAFGTLVLETMSFDTIVVTPGRMVVRGPPNAAGFAQSSSGSFFDGQPAVDVGPPGTLYWSDPVAYEISTYDASGTKTRVFRRDTPPTPIPGGLEDRIRAGLRAGLEEMMEGRPPEPDRVAELSERALPALDHEHVPYIESILVSDDGHMWVLRADEHPDLAMRAVAASFGYVRASWLPAWRAPQVFDRFGPDGAYLGSLELPTEFVPMDVTADLIVGLVRDELDVQYVTGFRVVER